MQQALCLIEQYIGKWKESSTRFTPGAVLFATVLGVVVEGVHGVIHSCDTFSLGTWRSATLQSQLSNYTMDTFSKATSEEDSCKC